MRGYFNDRDKGKLYLNIALIVLVVVFVLYLITKFLTPGIYFGPENIPIASSRIFSDTNLTESDLQGFCTAIDIDFAEGNLSCNYTWYKEDIQTAQGFANCSNIIETNIANISGSELQVGNWIFSCTAFDSYNYSEGVNSSTLFIDSLPLIFFSNSTTKTGSYKQKDILIEVSAFDINLENIDVYLYNSTGLVFTNSSNITISTIITNLPDDVYYLNASVKDKLNHWNYTETRRIVIDNIIPTFSVFADQSLRYGQQLSYQISATDNDAVGCISLLSELNSSFFNLSCLGLLVNSTALSPSSTYAYIINISVNDSAGNIMFKDMLITIGVTGDITSPVISNVSVSKTHSSAIVTWTTDEQADSLLEYGASSLTGNISSTTKENSHSLTLSDLNASTSYVYKVTSCDATGNCVSSSQLSFTTSATPSENKTYTPSYSSLTSGYKKTGLIADDVVVVSLNSSGNKHTIKVMSVSSSSASFKIDSGSSVSFSIGDVKSFDLVGDSRSDLEITLKNISNSQADLYIVVLTIQSDSSYISPVRDVSLDQTETPSDEIIATNSGSFVYIIWALILVGIIAIVVIVVLKQKELMDFFNNNFSSNKPSSDYLKICDLIKKAEFFIQQGSKDKASAIYGVIRGIFPSLRVNERENLKPRILKIFNSVNSSQNQPVQQNNSPQPNLKSKDLSGQGFYVSKP